MEKLKVILIKAVKWLGAAIIILSALKEWLEDLIPILGSLPF